MNFLIFLRRFFEQLPYGNGFILPYINVQRALITKMKWIVRASAD